MMSLIINLTVIATNWDFNMVSLKMELLFNIYAQLNAGKIKNTVCLLL